MSMSTRKPPEVPLRGFSCSLRWAKPFRLLLSVVPIQPFANIVANYACRDRDKESVYVIYKYRLLSAGGATAVLFYHVYL